MMKKRIFKRLKFIMIVFAIGIFSVVVLSCGGSSGGDDDNSNANDTNDPPQSYTASGTYTYNSDTGELTTNFTTSDFPTCGPKVGVDTITVDSVTATNMIWDEGEDGEIRWTRDSGTTGNIVGTWDFVDEYGNTYEATIDDSGSVFVIGEIVNCGDDTQDPGTNDDTQDPETNGATGTWSLSIVNDLDSRVTNTDCDIGETESDVLNFTETGDTFTFTTEDEHTFAGAIIGNVYTYTGTWEDEGATFTASGTFTLNSSLDSFTGSGAVNAVQGTDFCIWGQTLSGTRQGS